ncbi:MAG: hypothetical protein LAT56_12860 [Wenzhouxiangella sp.]|nr:hypothetical protein [Wenzhouxiangella sp.]
MGTITFDQPLDQTVTIDPDDFARGLGGFTRFPTGASYLSSTVIQLTGATANVAAALATGWYYTGTAPRLTGTNGLPVADFGPVT